MRTRLGQLLLRDDLVSDAQLARALEVQNFAGGRIGTLLMERGAIGEDDLGRTLAIQQGCAYTPWSTLLEIPADTIAVMPTRFALKHCAVPFERGEGYVKMALRDPGDLRILYELVFVTGRKVFVSVSPEVRIYQALEKYYGKLRAPRYAILAEKPSRPRDARVRATPPPPPPPPDFFGGAPRLAPAAPVAAGEPRSQGPSDAMPGAVSSSASSEPAPAPMPASGILEEPAANWAAFLSPAPEPTPSGELEGIAWEDTTGTRSKRRLEEPSETPPAPFAEGAAFDFADFDPLPEAPAAVPTPALADDGFTEVLAATDRDAIAEAVLEALARRFPVAAIFSSRSDGVAGWASVGGQVDGAAIRAFSTSWSESSVFLNVRLARTFYLGPLPALPRHDQLAAALGGWPEECVVQPVVIGEKPVAFLFVTAPRSGSVTSDDLDYIRELSVAASSAFANAIRLRKKDI